MELQKNVTLRKPIGLADLSYSTLQLREPTAGEMERCTTGATNSIGVLINLISVVAAVPRAAVEKLCQRDFQEATDFFARFGGDFLPSGETSLPNSLGSTAGVPVTPGA